MESDIGYFLFYLVLTLGFFLLVRKIAIWYWKINIIIENQTTQNKLLSSILNELRKTSNDDNIHAENDLNPAREKKLIYPKGPNGLFN